MGVGRNRKVLSIYRERPQGENLFVGKIFQFDYFQENKGTKCCI